MKHIGTFFSPLTAAQYTVKTFRESAEDFQKFEILFDNNPSYSKSIKGEIKAWVTANIDEWMAERRSLEWFKQENIPPEYLPEVLNDLQVNNHHQRRASARKTVADLPGFLFEGAHNNNNNNTNSNNRRMNLADQVASSNANPSAAELRRRHLSDLWATNADTVYNMRSNNFKSNYVHLQRVFGENDTLLQPLLERCPSFVVILAYIFDNSCRTCFVSPSAGFPSPFIFRYSSTC